MCTHIHSLCMYICTHSHTYTYTFMYACTYAPTHIHIHIIHSCMHMYAFTHACTDTCTRAHMYTLVLPLPRLAMCTPNLGVKPSGSTPRPMVLLVTAPLIPAPPWCPPEGKGNGSQVHLNLESCENQTFARQDPHSDEYSQATFNNTN
jgi:hypothetical protein